MLRKINILSKLNNYIKPKAWLSSNPDPSKISVDGSQSTLTATESNSAKPISAESEDKVEHDLYRHPQAFTIRLMGLVSGVNLMYWSSIIVNYHLFYGKVVEGINLAGDPVIGYVGCTASGFFFYFARHLAHHATFRSYLSSDRKRIGFQVHNMFGYPGRKFEVAIGNAKFLSLNQQNEMLQATKNMSPQLEAESSSDNSNAPIYSSMMKTSISKTGLFNSSFVPLKVTGFEGNLLIDKIGIQQSPNGRELVELLSSGEQVRVLDEKEKRINWRKATRSSSSAKNKKN